MKALVQTRPFSSLKYYASLMKPGIIAGNSITALGGYALASKGSINPLLLLAALFGLSFVIAAACVCNNYIDKDLDTLMVRTQTRALPRGRIQGHKALIFATLLAIFGCLILCLFTTLLTTVIALIGFFIYVVLYSFSKYISPLCTLIGSLAGAVPPVIGYSAVTNELDLCALLLFITVTLWQMPHFFAIALYRIRDYERASIPIMPIAKGMPATRRRMLLYVGAFTLCSSMLYRYTGYLYLVVSLAAGIAWLLLAIKGWSTQNITQWARQMFICSLLVITTLCLSMVLHSFL